MDGGAWWAAVHGVAKSWTRLSDFTFTFHFPALEKEMATHSSVLAWRIPGMGEPGGLPSMGSHRVGHDWSDLAAAAACDTVVKNLPANTGNVGSIPGSGKFHGGGNGNALRYSCLEKSMERGAWRATVHGVTKIQTWLSTHAIFLQTIMCCFSKEIHFPRANSYRCDYCIAKLWMRALKLLNHKVCCL